MVLINDKVGQRSPPKKLNPSGRTASLEVKKEVLQAEIADLEKQLGNIDAAKLVQGHIELLHTYNEVKDGAQALIGRYALLTGTTVTEIHERLGLSLTE
ncbi:hypothetical protein QFC21_000321 [Naganishia friedmannii]|uniref:Uncharacterized protein n=1 Tax=Naganishia friedmannii TaxID=89922 RepID=A0ACC2WCC3_9TREE|nr:hypothetical protein QFC21_000321 [Naganishia friedmannii]